MNGQGLVPLANAIWLTKTYYRKKVLRNFTSVEMCMAELGYRIIEPKEERLLDSQNVLLFGSKYEPQVQCHVCGVSLGIGLTCMRALVQGSQFIYKKNKILITLNRIRDLT